MAKAVRVRVSPTAPRFKPGASCFQPRSTGATDKVGARRRFRPWLLDGFKGLRCRGFETRQQTMNLEQYLPVILFILVGVAVGIIPQVLGALLGPHKPDPAKNSP